MRVFEHVIQRYPTIENQGIFIFLNNYFYVYSFFVYFFFIFVYYSL